MSFYRIQDFDPKALLDGEQTSQSYCTGAVQSGKSVCDSLEDLAAYIAQTGIPFDDTFQVIELDGYFSDDTDEDAELGARLVHPTEIITVTPISEQLLDMIFAACELAA